MNTKTAFIAGGTGGVGEGIVKVLLKNNFRVIVPTRSAYKAERLREYTADIAGGELITYIASLHDENDIQLLQEFVRKNSDTVNLAVASIGGWHQGYPVYTYPLNEWVKILNNNLTAHFLTVKAVVPLLSVESGWYVHINGFSADEQYPMAGPVAMTAAAQKSLILTLEKELYGTGIHVNELILGPMKTRDRLKHGHGQHDWYFPEEIGEYIFQLSGQHTNEKVVHYLLKKT
jgi:NAD(P)-dependent dehydrogenase (short-subunit alcohol dehydrogenase family)